MENNQRLSILEKLSYGAGDLACNLFWGLICMATAFYTDYFGIAPAVVGTMVLVVSCIDIAFDVIIGAIADRHNTRWGRFRPWILFGVVPFCVIGFFTFYTPEFNETGKVIYAYATFLLCRLMYSVVNVPYGALMGVISPDPDERTSVSAFRNIGAQIGCLCSYGMVFTLVRFIQDHLQCSGQAAFSWTAFIYAIAAFVMLMCTFFFTRERVEPVKQETSKLSDDVKDLCKNKPWIMLSIAGIAMLFFVFVHNGLIPYYAKYCLADYNIVDGKEVFTVSGTLFGIKLTWELVSTLLLASGSVFTIIGTMLIQTVVKKFGKKPTWIACFTLASLLSLSFLVLDRSNIGTIIILNIIFTLAIGPSGYIMWSMYADVADNAEVETGRRATGLIYSSATMAQKLGQALANSIPAYALAAIGFVANTQLSPETIESLKSYFSLLPLVGSVIGILALVFYKIDEDTIRRNSAILEAKRAEEKDKQGNSQSIEKVEEGN
ncbi:MAG: MFS transporter [Paludibacteraceae bacterium]|nr:MFS transporter [Paludibacteraceae bacterium]